MTDHLAHDLRSPLTRIRGHAEVTLTTARSLGEYENMAANTIEECDRLLDMIKTMLLISKTESGVDTFSFEAPTAEDKAVTLSCDVPVKSLLAGDTRMIQRMLSNLLDNAIKYDGCGGDSG